MELRFTEEEVAFRQEVRAFIRENLPAKTRERLRLGYPPTKQDVVTWQRILNRKGWATYKWPQEYGGQTWSPTMRMIFQDENMLAHAPEVNSFNITMIGPVLIQFGTPEQKERFIAPTANLDIWWCQGFSEPGSGSDLASLKTSAVRDGDDYVVNGQKIWTSTAQVADKILLLARTTPLESVRKKTEGLSLFYTTLDRSKVEVRRIEKMGRKAVDSNQVFFDGLEIPIEDRIGEEGRGFEYILHGMNPERILIAAEAVGVGLAALARATSYAKERRVFGRPIGQNQGIQHPLAENWMELEAARLMTMNAAWLYDRGENAGAAANAAKYLAGEAGFKACTQAVMTHGGMGYAKEYHVERYLRESMIPRIAPISPQLVLCYIAERVLGLPKSY